MSIDEIWHEIDENIFVPKWAQKIITIPTLTLRNFVISYSTQPTPTQIATDCPPDQQSLSPLITEF